MNAEAALRKYETILDQGRYLEVEELKELGRLDIPGSDFRNAMRFRRICNRSWELYAQLHGIKPFEYPEMHAEYSRLVCLTPGWKARDERVDNRCQLQDFPAWTWFDEGMERLVRELWQYW